MQVPAFSSPYSERRRGLAKRQLEQGLKQMIHTIEIRRPKASTRCIASAMSETRGVLPQSIRISNDTAVKMPSLLSSRELNCPSVEQHSVHIVTARTTTTSHSP